MKKKKMIYIYDAERDVFKSILGEKLEKFKIFVINGNVKILKDYAYKYGVISTSIMFNEFFLRLHRMTEFSIRAIETVPINHDFIEILCNMYRSKRYRLNMEDLISFYRSIEFSFEVRFRLGKLPIIRNRSYFGRWDVIIERDIPVFTYNIEQRQLIVNSGFSQNSDLGDLQLFRLNHKCEKESLPIYGYSALEVENPLNSIVLIKYKHVENILVPPIF